MRVSSWVMRSAISPTSGLQRSCELSMNRLRRSRMKIFNLGCGTESGVILHFAGPPAPIHGKSKWFQVVAGISITQRRTGFINISVSRPALCFPGLMVKARELVATSDDAAKSPSIRLKEFEFREEEFQVQAGQRVVPFGTNSATPHLSHMNA